VLELKKLMPYRLRVNVEHVVSVYGTGLTAMMERAAMIDEINEESLKALKSPCYMTPRMSPQAQVASSHQSNGGENQQRLN
jgi:hypothetical protein